jgi:sugar phosphate permease
MLSQLPHVNLSVDSLILLTVVLIIIGGVMLGQQKVKTFALSIYVGIVLADQLGQPLYDFVKSSSLGAAIGLGNLKLILLGAPIVGLELGHNKDHAGRRRGMVLTMILSVLTAALLIATVLSLLDPGGRQSVLNSSTLATLFYQLRLWWLGLVPVVVVFESFMSPHR